MIAALARVRALVLGVLGVALLAGTWDLYKAFGPEDGVRVGERTLVLPRATDLAMPHTWEMVQRLTEPVTERRRRAVDGCARCSTPACSPSRSRPRAG